MKTSTAGVLQLQSSTTPTSTLSARPIPSFTLSDWLRVRPTRERSYNHSVFRFKIPSPLTSITNARHKPTRGNPPLFLYRFPTSQSAPTCENHGVFPPRLSTSAHPPTRPEQQEAIYNRTWICRRRQTSQSRSPLVRIGVAFRGLRGSRSSRTCGSKTSPSALVSLCFFVFFCFT